MTCFSPPSGTGAMVTSTQFVVVRLEFCCNDRMNRFEASPNSLSTKSFSRLKPAPYWWACSR